MSIEMMDSEIPWKIRIFFFFKSVLWLPDAKSQLTGKDPDAGKDWRQEEKGMAEDKLVEWHH